MQVQLVAAELAFKVILNMGAFLPCIPGKISIDRGLVRQRDRQLGHTHRHTGQRAQFRTGIQAVALPMAGQYKGGLFQRALQRNLGINHTVGQRLWLGNRHGVLNTLLLGMAFYGIVVSNDHTRSAIGINRLGCRADNRFILLSACRSRCFTGNILRGFILLGCRFWLLGISRKILLGTYGGLRSQTTGNDLNVGSRGIRGIQTSQLHIALKTSTDRLVSQHQVVQTQLSAF